MAAIDPITGALIALDGIERLVNLIRAFKRGDDVTEEDIALLEKIAGDTHDRLQSTP